MDEVTEYMYIKVICNDGKLIVRRVIEPPLFIIIVEDCVISEALKLKRLFSSCVILNLIFHSNLAKKTSTERPVINQHNISEFQSA